MKTILCYGDSNTWGHPPLKSLADPVRRYGPDERWTGVMRNRLGDGYAVIEEGLSGRTSVFDDPVEGVHKNGRTYLLPCLESAAPVDLVTIMLGTNDLKSRFAAPAFDIAWGVSQLAGMILNSTFGPDGGTPKVLIICPPPLAKLTALAELFVGADEKCRLLPGHYSDWAKLVGAGFLDAGQIIHASDGDGIHFELSEHHKLGEAVAAKVSEMLA